MKDLMENSKTLNSTKLGSHTAEITKNPRQKARIRANGAKSM
jgi:hypothetical protein